MDCKQKKEAEGILDRMRELLSDAEKLVSETRKDGCQRAVTDVSNWIGSKVVKLEGNDCNGKYYRWDKIRGGSVEVSRDRLFFEGVRSLGSGTIESLTRLMTAIKNDPDKK